MDKVIVQVKSISSLKELSGKNIIYSHKEVEGPFGYSPKAAGKGRLYHFVGCPRSKSIDFVIYTLLVELPTELKKFDDNLGTWGLRHHVGINDENSNKNFIYGQITGLKLPGVFDAEVVDFGQLLEWAKIGEEAGAL